ncbi:MAG TPA: hypothetical protein VN794_17355 [Methylomirabilota bacterium]|jgi:hypothetical protein|nr:hypothetical protein [Methylomirabilota bacterium]
MKPIQKQELYKHLSEFLKNKGVELKEGSYTRGIHAGCSLLADAINLSQAGFERAKAGLDKKVDQVRQVIHAKTAPKTGAATQPTAGPNKTDKPPVGTRSKSTGRKPADRKKTRGKKA